LDPAKFAGLAEGDAHVIRNAGGRASEDAIRSLVISYKLLGTREWFVVHHVDCGMLTFTDPVLGDLLAQSLEPAVLGPAGWEDRGQGPGSFEGVHSVAVVYGSGAKRHRHVTRLRQHPSCRATFRFTDTYSM
jgi:carbonic anhydrase